MCKISVEISVQFQKIPIADIENFAISAADILPIRYTYRYTSSTYICTIIIMYKYPFIKTHDSESRGQEEAGHMQRMSELFTHSTTLKFVNALNKLLLKLSLSYQGLSAF